MKPFHLKVADVDGNKLKILGIPFGGPLNGRDTDGEYFSAKTDLCLGWYGTIPLLYHHGLDSTLGRTQIGTVDLTTATKSDEGWWFQAQLDEHVDYIAEIKKLIDKGVLFASSGAYPHLVERSKSGELLVWPMVELSTTPTPANLFGVVDWDEDETAKHFKSAGIDFAAIKARLDAETEARKSAEVDPPATTEPTTTEVPPAEETKSTDPDTGLHSYEDRISALNDAINGFFNRNLPWGDSEAYAYVADTFPDHCIVRYCNWSDSSDPDEGYWRVEYTTDDQGTVTLGAATRVEQAYLPAKSAVPFSTAPLALSYAHATKALGAAAARTKDVTDRRAKEGRTLSAANRQRLSALCEQIKTAASDLEVLLASTDPDAKATDPSDLQALLDMRLREAQAVKALLR